ncbi:gene transfer agent family protein [Ruegeria arenilitoris]|uniref:Uncharacterized protein n=1 Tax=Ruegeria arenilitoris TaxID=1173585 RepID=A0A238JXA8_9RHOB|nr:gene transfer agent family protein [Ruegeria arenilitoris]SMX35281.1 hypothetical protein RUA8715_00884 [Ruegeria arenilitoris]
MVNPWTGEVALVIDGQRRVLKLTLGALAELEQELGAGSLVELVQRFEGGAYSSGDVLGQGRGMPAMNRARLDKLLAAWPDKIQGERDDGSGRV